VKWRSRVPIFAQEKNTQKVVAELSETRRAFMQEGFDPIENLKKIREFTERNITPLKSLGTFVNDEVSYECLKGSCKGWALKKTEHVAVQYAEMEANTEMREHTHIGNDEYLIVIEGELFSRIGEEVSSARAGGCLHIEAGQTHVPFCEVQTKIIGVTVPASEGYPNARTE
jgi:mannose-6-phosphate isomerase-like protein (cupin superfamily)